jgi:hypothetical protein
MPEASLNCRPGKTLEKPYICVELAFLLLQITPESKGGRLGTHIQLTAKGRNLVMFVQLGQNLARQLYLSACRYDLDRE